MGAESQAAQARSALKSGDAKAAQQIHFLDAKTARQVHAAKSEASQAQSTSRSGSYVTLFLFVVMLCMLVKFGSSPRGRAFKDRMSNRLSGMVGRKNDKVQPLLKNDRMNDRMVG